MGFSYTAAAGRMMGGIEAVCAATRPQSETAANVFFVNGKRHFHEMAAQEAALAAVACIRRASRAGEPEANNQLFGTLIRLEFPVWHALHCDRDR